MRCCGVCLLVFATFCELVATESADNEEETILKTVFNASVYNKEIRPPAKTKIMVRVNVFVRDVFLLDEVKRELRLQVTLRLRWKDERLVYNASSPNINHLVLSPAKSLTALWIPDVFIMNEKEASMHRTPSDNVLTRIYPNGQVQHSTRLSLTISCPVTSTYFPFGSVRCPLKIASYSREVSEMNVSWDDGGLVFHKGIELDGYSLDNSTMKAEQCIAITKLGKYSCVTSILRFTRMPRRWLLTFYVPCIGLMSCAALAAILRKKNENVVNTFCFVACLGITLQNTANAMDIYKNSVVHAPLQDAISLEYERAGRVKDVPSSNHMRSIDVWIVAMYGFFLLHTLIYSYPKARKGSQASDADSEQAVARERFYEILEKHISAIFYGCTFMFVIFYFIIVRIIAGAMK